jgi:hypothetical protein
MHMYLYLQFFGPEYTVHATTGKSGHSSDSLMPLKQEGWTPEDEAVLQQLRPPSLPPSAPASPLLLVVNKVDDTLPTVTSNHQTPRPPHHSVAVPLPSIASSTVQPAPTESAPAASTLPGDCDSQTIQLKVSSNACVASIPESVTARVSNAVAASAMTAGGLDDLKSIVLAMTDAADIATGMVSALSLQKCPRFSHGLLQICSLVFILAREEQC